MWETTVLPFLLMWWPAIAVVMGVVILIYLLRYILTNSQAQSVLAAIISSEVVIIAIFGDKAKDIFDILRVIQQDISDQNLTVEEAQEIAEKIIKEAFEELDIELSVIHWAILKFVVNKIIEAIILYGKTDEVEVINNNMRNNLNVAQFEVSEFKSKK